MLLIRLGTFAAGLVLLTACHEQAAPTTQGPLPPTPAAAGPQCYAFASERDTVRLTLQTTQPAITGQLTYQYFEKDRNQGSIRGTMHGDTLLALYTFQSEGRESKREVAFLRQGSGLVEGYGNVVERGGKMVFQQPHSLQFDAKNVLAPVACPQQRELVK